MFFPILNHHIMMILNGEKHGLFAVSDSFEYLLYTSESDVHRRQIVTYKDDPRAERVNPFALFFIKYLSINHRDQRVFPILIIINVLGSSS